MADLKLNNEVKNITYPFYLKGTSFNWIQNKDEREKLPIIVYVAYFKIVNGFKKTLYMTKEQMENHFMKYSKTYAKNKSFYIASFNEMALKQY